MRTYDIGRINRKPIVGDIVIALGTHVSYPDVYDGYLSTITKVEPNGTYAIRNTNFYWVSNTNYWAILDTYPMSINTELNVGMLIIHKDFTIYKILDIREDFIITNNINIYKKDLLHYRIINSTTIDPEISESLPYLCLYDSKRAVFREYTKYDYALMMRVLDKDFTWITLSIKNKFNTVVKLQNKDEIIDYIIKNIQYDEVYEDM